MKHFIISGILAFLSIAVGYSQKEYRAIRSALKTGQSLEQNLAQIAKYSEQEKFKNDPELYQYGLLINQKINEAENEKAYLKQKYDTVKFFSTIYGLFDYALKCDAKEQMPDSHGKIKYKYRHKNAELLRLYYQNLRNGGQFFLLKKKYDEAYKYFSMYLDAAQSQLLSNISFFQNSRIRNRVAYWANICSFATRKPMDFQKYSKWAESDSVNRCQVLEMKSEMSALLGDTLLMLNTLQTGINEYPQHQYFFSHLVDYYNNHSLYEKSLSLCDSLLHRGVQSVLVKYAKSVVLLNLKRNETSIQVSREIIKEDSLYADAYYNIGLAYCNLAHDKEQEISLSLRFDELQALRTGIKSLYRNALPYMERYRKMEPLKKDKWGTLLYQIYLALNKEKEFKEIDKLLNTVQ